MECECACEECEELQRHYIVENAILAFSLDECIAMLRPFRIIAVLQGILIVLLLMLLN